jgi:hypothetical protein
MPRESVCVAATNDRMTFRIPREVKRRAKKMKGVNWSSVVTKAIEETLTQLEYMDRLAAKSKLTQADVDEVADMIDTAMAKRYGLLK